MEVHFTPELEERLAQSAAEQGCEPEKLVQEVLTRYFDEQALFADAVKRGEDALQKGDYLTHEQMGERLKRFL